MGRPKNSKANAPKPPKATRKSTTKTPVPCAKVKLRPLPAKGDIKPLAAHRSEFSKKLLGNRLKKLSKEDLALFKKLSKLSDRQLRRLKSSNTRVIHGEDTKAFVQERWSVMVKNEGHKATVEEFQEDLLDEEYLEIPRTTLQRWFREIKRKPYAPPYERESNDPDMHWRLVGARRR